MDKLKSIFWQIKVPLFDVYVKFKNENGYLSR